MTSFVTIKFHLGICHVFSLSTTILKYLQGRHQTQDSGTKFPKIGIKLWYHLHIGDWQGAGNTHPAKHLIMLFMILTVYVYRKIVCIVKDANILTNTVDQSMCRLPINRPNIGTCPSVNSEPAILRIQSRVLLVTYVYELPGMKAPRAARFNSVSANGHSFKILSPETFYPRPINAGA